MRVYLSENVRLEKNVKVWKKREKKICECFWLLKMNCNQPSYVSVSIKIHDLNFITDDDE